MQLKQSRALSNSEKYYLLTNHFVPPHNDTFPPHEYGKQKRHFQLNWLSKFNGLVYSELDDGAYCKYCVLFGQPSPFGPALVGTFITRPLTHLGKASEKLREYFQGVKGGSARKYIPFTSCADGGTIYQCHVQKATANRPATFSSLSSYCRKELTVAQVNS